MAKVTIAIEDGDGDQLLITEEFEPEANRRGISNTLAQKVGLELTKLLATEEVARMFGRSTVHFYAE